MNYDWIKKLLKSVITQKSYSDYTEKILKDYYIFITDDYNFEPYYSVCNDPIKQLSRNHRALLRQLREAKSDRHKGALIKGLEFEQIEELCSRETKKNSIYRKLYNLYNKYWGILDEMENYSFHDLLGQSGRYRLCGAAAAAREGSAVSDLDAFNAQLFEGLPWRIRELQVSSVKTRIVKRDLCSSVTG